MSERTESPATVPHHHPHHRRKRLHYHKRRVVPHPAPEQQRSRDPNVSKQSFIDILQRSVSDSNVMRELRTIAHQAGAAARSDLDVIERIAHELWIGRMVLWPPLHAGPQPMPVRKGSGGAGKAETPQTGVPASISNDGEAARLSLATLAHFEGYSEYMYRDSRGYVTVGVGKMLPRASAAADLPFVTKAGVPATRDQITAAFATVEAMAAGRAVSFYTGKTDVRMTPQTIQELLGKEIHKSVEGLLGLFPDFKRYPTPAQQALIDMVYNLGAGGPAKHKGEREHGLYQYHTLRKSVQKEDWTAAAAECHRNGPNAERNNWTRDTFLKAAKVGAPLPPLNRSAALIN